MHEPSDPSDLREPGEIGGSLATAAGEAYRQLFESHPAAMAIWDPETGQIIAANEAAERQYGYGRDELFGLRIEDIVHPDDLARLRAQLPGLPAGHAGAAPYRHVRRDGQVIEVEVSGHPIVWHGRPARLVMALDVTARSRLEQELRSARAIEAVGRLAGGIAHDFNNLVMAINGFAELLLERLSEPSEERDAALEIRTAGLRAAALTSQLLAFARPHQPHPTRFDLNELVSSMELTLRGISGPNVRVRIETSAQEAMIFADRDQIARAIVGCVLNSRDAMPDGGDLGVTTIGVDAHRARELTGAVGDRPFVALAISDTGPTGGRGHAGGPAGNAIGTTPTGLGLALVYSTVQLAGGRIRLESTPGRGSTVRILLPLDAADAAAVRVLSPDPASDPIDTTEPEDRPIGPTDIGGGPVAGIAVGDGVVDDGHPSVDAPAVTSDVAVVEEPGTPAVIAVIEDEPGVRTLVERILVRDGHRVLAFPDGSAALDALADPNLRVDLLITDLVMPGPNGIEVARRIREDRPDLPVLLMSGYAADALRSEGLEESAVELLSKPFAAADLLGRTAAALRARTAARG